MLNCHESHHDHQLRRANEMRNEFLVAYPCNTAAQIAALTCTDVLQTTQQLDVWEIEGRILSLAAPTGKLYPRFQFQWPNLQPCIAVARVLSLLKVERNPWELAMWFASPHPSLPETGHPADFIERDPDAVIRVAEIDSEEILY